MGSHGGGGPGLDGSVSARTYFREQRERMLLRGLQVRNYESAEIAYLASCRLRNHFTQQLESAVPSSVKNPSLNPASKKRDSLVALDAQSSASNNAHVRPPERDRQFNWLAVALKDHMHEGRISDDSLDALLQKVGLRMGTERVRLFVEWLSYPETVPEEDPILHDILQGTQEAAEAKAAAALAASEAAAAAEAAAAKAAAEVRVHARECGRE